MKKYRESPLFLKSEEIYETLKIITYLIPEDNEYLQFTMKTTNFNTISFAQLHKYCELVHQPQKFSGQKSSQYRSRSLYY